MRVPTVTVCGVAKGSPDAAVVTGTKPKRKTRW